MADEVFFYHQESIEIETEDQTKEVYLMAGDAGIQKLIDFHKGDEPLPMPRVNEVMLTVGVAEAMGIDVGDQIVLRNADMKQLNLTVSGIYDNHVDNNAIVIPETIEAQWGEAPELQMALIKVAEGQDVYSLSAAVTGMNGVMNVSVSEDFAGMVRNMMDALDLVVWVVVVCAGLLAAIVLYNLTNINITERIREIATIKVLGFNSGETGAYVFKENLSLTVIGSVLGLGLGYLLLLFVMSQIKIDMVWFKALVMPKSYVLAIVLTMLAACLVDFIFYFKLEKINMAEALKSVE
jgi:putative ABC transport system permease protein